MGLNTQIDVNSLSTVRGRGGFIWAENFLFFGTGGVAWAQTQNRWDYTCPSVGVGGVGCTLNAHAPVTLTQTKTGSVWGGGVDWMPAVARGKLVFGIEYLNYRFKGSSATGTTVSLANGAPVVFPVPGTCVVGAPCIPYTASNLNISDMRGASTL